MALLLIGGCVLVLSKLASRVNGQTVTQETEATGTPVQERSDVSWYVVPAIVWSSVAAFFLLVVIVLGFCFFYKRRNFTETGHQRFYNIYEREKESARHQHRHSKKLNKSKRGNSKRRKNNEAREYDTLGGMRVQTVDLDNVLAVPPGWDNRSRSHSHRSEVESELFNINKINPVYDFSTENQSRQMAVDNSRNDRAGNYGSGDIVIKLYDSARDLSRVPSVRGSAAASFSGLPAPSVRTSGSHVVHVKYEMTTRKEDSAINEKTTRREDPVIYEKTIRKEEPAIYRGSTEQFQDTYIPDPYDSNQAEPNNLTHENANRSSYKVEASTFEALAPLRSNSGQFVVSEEADIEQTATVEAHMHFLDEHSDSNIEQDPSPSVPIPSDYISTVIEQSPAPVDGTYKSYIEPVPEPDIMVATTRKSSSSSESSHAGMQKADTRGKGRRGFGLFNALEDLISYHPPPKKT